MTLARRHVAIALLFATGSVACADDDAAVVDQDVPAAAAETATTLARVTTQSADVDTGDVALAAAFEFAQCMRDSGIEDFADPQIRADGDFFLSPPADVDDEELRVVDEACAHIADAFRTNSGTVTTINDVAAGWERIVPGGDCQCADGSEFSFSVRAANPNKALVYLQGGGACFSAETCAPDSDGYTTAAKGPTGAAGIFDFADERNPFADYSVVYVPYCTGDVHLGNTTTEYAAGLTVHHKGYVNGTAALDYVAASAPGATDVVVVGESAGSIAAPMYAGLVSDRLPDARITVLADGSGSYPDVPRIRELIAAWGFGTTVPSWFSGARSTAEQWSFPGLFVESGQHDPDIVFARHDYAYDETQQRWNRNAGVPAADLLSMIDANETIIEAAGVNLVSFIAPGNGHTALSDGAFYTEEVNSQLLVDWVTALVEREPVEDVHCTDCTAS